jgi:sterol desaturase/sphingolipid hydroxylase (fatty acid hydroxylase superfamily)
LLVLLGMTVFLIALIALAELRAPARGEPSARLHNLFAFACQQAVQLTLLPLIALAPIVAQHSLANSADWPFVPAVIAFTLLMDFGEFSYHRLQHAVPFLWRMHALHHSDPNMNVTTAVRHFWGDQLLKAVTIWPACAWLLNPSPAIVIGYALIGFYHYFVHANLPVSFGRWSWLLNSPAYHRRHHSSLPAHWNCNYAGLFPIYDLIFFSYRRPDGFPPTGLDQRPQGLLDISVWPLRVR